MNGGGYFHEKLAAERAKTQAAQREADGLRAVIRKLQGVSSGRTLTEWSILEDRMAHLTWAATGLSEGGYVLIRTGIPSGEKENQWRINVRCGEMEHTSTARQGPNIEDICTSLALAMDRAVQWLRAARAQETT